MKNVNKKKTRKLDFKTYYDVIDRFRRKKTSLRSESRKLGFHQDIAKRVLTGETKTELSLKRKEWLIRLSKGLPIEEPKTETTGEPA